MSRTAHLQRGRMEKTDEGGNKEHGRAKGRGRRKKVGGLMQIWGDRGNKYGGREEENEFKK